MSILFHCLADMMMLGQERSELPTLAKGSLTSWREEGFKSIESWVQIWSHKEMSSRFGEQMKGMLMSPRAMCQGVVRRWNGLN